MPKFILSIIAILYKLNPSFKGWVCIIVAFFLSPFIGVFINYWFGIDWGPLFTFGILDLKDFFTVWIALFGAIGIAFNIYQNQKRTKNQEEQLEKQQTQIDLQRKSQRDSRFSKGIELLGNDNESARTGAAYSLCFLANDYPDEFSKPVFDILCSHIRTLTTSEEYLKKHPTVSNEVQTILDLLFKFKDTDDNNTTPFSKYKANLREAHLEKAHLKEVHLEGAYLEKAHLEKAHLEKAILRGAHLDEAFLENAYLEEALLEDAYLTGTSLKHTYMEDAHLERAVLIIAILTNAHLERTNLNGAFLQKAHLEGAQLEGANLEGADLEGAFINSSMKPFFEKSEVDLSKVKWIDDKIRYNRNSTTS